uniref:Variant surface glycoprotein 1125.202 n=1 Tax=Trypanosoma brucei TaxID=5691 RepID=A0A1J0R5C3_9TRYP|nr:variant surface glycoprotein 1125.202 [Trypanosoma brucei]
MFQTEPWEVAVAFALAISPANAQINDYANIEIFRKLCTTVQWTAATFALPATQQTQPSIYTEMIKLNLSLADATWRRQFKKQAEPLQWKDTPPDSHKNDADFKTLWADWLKAAKELNPETKVTEEASKWKLNDLTKSKLDRARREISQATRKAKRLTERWTLLENRKKLKTANDALKRLTLAIYGDENNSDGTIEKAKVFKGGPGGSRDANCRGKLANNKAPSVAAVLLCLCTKGNKPTQVAKPCTDFPSVGTEWAASGKNWPTVFANLIKTCPNPTAAPLHAQTILQMVTAIKTSFNLQDTAAYLGAFQNTDCDGSNAKGVCVGYTDVGNTATEKLDTIPWLRQLRDLADDLAAATSTTSQQHAITEKLNEIKSDAQELHANLHQTLVEAKAATNQSTVTSTKPSAQKQERDLRKSNKTTCENAGKCEWEGKTETDDPCEVDESKYTKTTTGTGDEVETPQISNFKKKDDCKSTDCKLEGESCKDFIFLVNNKNFSDCCFVCRLGFLKF